MGLMMIVVLYGMLPLQKIILLVSKYFLKEVVLEMVNIMFGIPILMVFVLLKLAGFLVPKQYRMVMKILLPRTLIVMA